jgi:hypothetical protein
MSRIPKCNHVIFVNTLHIYCTWFASFVTQLSEIVLGFDLAGVSYVKTPIRYDPVTADETRWDPVALRDGENGGFRTGCPVFTDLWSYVFNICMLLIIYYKSLLLGYPPSG